MGSHGDDWNSSPTRSAPPGGQMNGYHPPGEFGLGMIMGQVATEQRRQTEILLGMQQRLENLPDQIADRLPRSEAGAPKPGSAATHQTNVQQITDLLRAVVPLALLAAIVVGKLTLLEGLPLIRHSLGIP